MSSIISNPDRPSRLLQQRRKKKKLLQQNQPPKHNVDVQNLHCHVTKWKSETQQHLYSSKLLHALNHVSDDVTAAQSDQSTCPPRPPRRGRAVRDAADRVLAAAAKGRTRWSRAILTKRLKIKFRHHRKSQAAGSGAGKMKKQRFSVLRLKGKGLPAVQRKVRVLGRLVPGCRKQPLPVILEEATDYIAALEMQVRAMSRLTQLLSVSGAGGSSSSAPPSS